MLFSKHLCMILEGVRDAKQEAVMRGGKLTAVALQPFRRVWTCWMPMMM